MGRPLRKRVLIVVGWHNPNTLRGFCRYARQAHWVLDTSSLMTGVVPAHWHGDGIPTTNVTDARIRTRLDALGRRLPVVLHGTNRAGADYPSVEVDERMTGRLAAEHLFSRGYRQFASLMRTNDVYTDLRREGFEHVIAEAGRPVERLRCRPLSFQPQPTGLARSLARLRLPLGLFAQDDLLAAAAIDAAHVLGWRVPEDLGVVGVGDNAVVCEYSQVPISSVALPAELQAFEAARMLDQLMRGELPPERHAVLPPSEVVVRHSSDHLAVDHPALRRAVAFLREQAASRDLSVARLAKAAGVSRAKLHVLFQRELRTTPRRLLKQVRMERARHLLVTTEDKTLAIAASCGFACVRTFQRAFWQLHGQHPTDWRGAAR